MYVNVMYLIKITLTTHYRWLSQNHFCSGLIFFKFCGKVTSKFDLFEIGGLKKTRSTSNPLISDLLLIISLSNVYSDSATNILDHELDFKYIVSIVFKYSFLCTVFEHKTNKLSSNQN